MTKTGLLDKFSVAREDMVRLLKDRGISDERVLAAMLKVERHLFVPLPLRNHGYEEGSGTKRCRSTFSIAAKTLSSDIPRSLRSRTISSRATENLSSNPVFVILQLCYITLDRPTGKFLP